MVLDKKALPENRQGFDKNWQRLTLPHFIAVPSARVGLTSLFGMGRGGPHRHSHHKVFVPLGLGKNGTGFFYISVWLIAWDKINPATAQ